MPGRRRGVRPKAFTFLAFGILLAVLQVTPAVAATVIRLSWGANSETDLAGYRLRYGTVSGTYGSPISVGKVTSYDLAGLSSGTTYYFVVTAYDLSGNESGFSNQASGQPSTVVGPAPTISSATELSTNSPYVLEAGRHSVRINGTNFQNGATVDLGSNLSVGSASIAGGTQITVTVDVAATAALGWRTAIVSNPDGGAGSRSQALMVTRNADINRDCLVDGGDLNLIAVAWNSVTANARFNSSADLDGDGLIDGDDMTIFIKYFGKRLSICP